MTLQAKAGCCQESALGLPGYIPCNAPAKFIVHWPGRPDAAIRMCEGCADHNVRNRGGAIVGPVEAAATNGHDEFRPIGQVAQAVVNQIAQDTWSGWRTLLTNPNAPRDPNAPFQGFYRTRKFKDGPWVPVSYWYQDGKLLCLIDSRLVDETTAIERWPFISKHPVEHEVYEAVIAGQPWPDENAAVVGHNKGPVGDGIAEIQDRIDNIGREAERLIKLGAATTKDVADQASDLANVLAELATKADQSRDGEKRPHLEAGRNIDAKWRPLIERATGLKTTLRAVVLTPYLTRLDGEKRTAAAAAVAAGTPVEQVQAPKATAGSIKRSSGLRTFKRADVEDWPKLLDALKDHPLIREVAQKIADDAAKRDIAMAGCRIISEKRAV